MLRLCYANRVMKEKGITHETVMWWILNRGVPDLTPLGGFKVSLAFYPSEVDHMNSRDTWGINGKK